MSKNTLNIKKHGFKTPEGYFDALETKIIDTVKLSSKMPQEVPFKVPENYFDTLSEKIEMNTISKTKKTKVISLFAYRPLRYVASIAAVLAVLFSIFIFQNNLTFKSEASLSDVSEYIENELIYFSDLELQELISEQPINDEVSNTTISNEELLDYLSYTLRDDHIFNE